jgi:hypothetical protein
MLMPFHYNDRGDVLANLFISLRHSSHGDALQGRPSPKK